MEGDGGEFPDWEMLQSSGETGSVVSSDSGDVMRGLDGIEGDSGGMIRDDYFSIDLKNNHESVMIEEGAVEIGDIDPELETRYPANNYESEMIEEGSVEIGNIDPGLETRYPANNYESVMIKEGADEIGNIDPGLETRYPANNYESVMIEEGADEIGNIDPGLETRYSGNNYESVMIVEGAVESDDSSWIDPGLVNRYAEKESGELSSDSVGDMSVDRKLGEFDAPNELDFAGDMKSEGAFDGIGSEDWSDSVLKGPAEMEFGDSQTHNEMDNHANANPDEDLQDSTEDYVNRSSEIVKAPEAEAEAKAEGGEKSIITVTWWKLPYHLLKYCCLKVNPVWTFSFAAAVMGLLILGRRLNKMMKKKTHGGFQLTVTMDEKKVSQFKTRAARLNEAFSIVKRVPVIRPPLSAPGVAPWLVVTP